MDIDIFRFYSLDGNPTDISYSTIQVGIEEKKAGGSKAGMVLVYFLSNMVFVCVEEDDLPQRCYGTMIS